MSHDPINPSHYQAETADGYPLQAIDVIEAFGLGAHEAMAAKHLLRNGHKPGELQISDLMKAVWYLDRKIEVLQAEAAGKVIAGPNGQADPVGLDGDAESFGSADGPTWSSDRQRLEQIVGAVRYELLRATFKHPPISSPHEGIAVLREELDELWAEIKRQKPDRAAMRAEAVQVAAMAIRFVRDVCPEPADKEI